MRRLILLFAAASIGAPAMSQVHVRGYVKRDGTYVAPSYRSSPDSSIYNNYSTAPNVNPYSGRSGSVNPYAPSTLYSSPTYGYRAPKAPCYGYCPK